MNKKYTLEFIPINKKGHLVNSEIAGINEKESFLSVKSASKWINDNKLKICIILGKTYGKKIDSFSGFEIRILKDKKIEKKIKLEW